METIAIVAAVLILIFAGMVLRRGRKASAKRHPAQHDQTSPQYWPHFVDGREAVARWIRDDNRERVYLIRRPDGAYNTYAERFEIEPDDQYDQSWVSVSSSSLYASETIATKEIAAEWPWTKNKSPEKRMPNSTPEGICQRADGLPKSSA